MNRYETSNELALFAVQFSDYRIRAISINSDVTAKSLSLSFFMALSDEKVRLKRGVS